MEWLKLLKDEEITNIRKICKNGVTDSYEKYQIIWIKMPDRKEKRMKASIYFKNNIVACDSCSGSNVIRLF